jgi:hypothetical protein
MTQAKHTSGEWIAVGPWVEHPNDTTADICSCDPRNFGQQGLNRSDEEQCANARLIAAAPDMLEALKAADRELAFAGHESEWPTRAQIIAAIARAEGRS